MIDRVISMIYVKYFNVSNVPEVRILSITEFSALYLREGGREPYKIPDNNFMKRCRREEQTRKNVLSEIVR